MHLPHLRQEEQSEWLRHQYLVFCPATSYYQAQTRHLFNAQPSQLAHLQIAQPDTSCGLRPNR